MMTILLYGHLGRQFGRVHKYDVRSAAEAVKAMCVTLDGFRTALRDGGAYRVLVGGREALDMESVRYPISQRSTLRLVPVIAGAGRGLGQFLMGAALLTLSVVGFIFMPGYAPVWEVLGNSGFALMIGGVAQMLFAPKTADSTQTERPENRVSYAFNGAVNTAAQGNAVSLLYGGPLIVGSQVVSAGLSVEQIA